MPHGDHDDHFTIDGAELIACPDRGGPTYCQGATGVPGVYYATRASSYRRILHGQDGRWVMWTKDGHRTMFKPEPSAGGGPTVTWREVSRTDAFGNTVTIGYRAADLALLPDTISYGATHVQFYWEPRPDAYKVGTGQAVRTVAERLASLVVRRHDRLVTAYAVDYQASGVLGGGAVMGVRRYGSDATVAPDGRLSGGSEPLPVATFGHASRPERAVDWPTTIPSRLPPAITDPTLTGGVEAHDIFGSTQGGADAQQWTTADINGDGYSDFVGVLYYKWSFKGCGRTVDRGWLILLVGLVRPNGTVSERSPVCLGRGATLAEPTDVRVLTGDMNGDGLTDVVVVNRASRCESWVAEECAQDEPGGFIRTALSRADGTVVTPPAQMVPNPDWNARVRWMVGDINGDARADLLATWPDVADPQHLWVERGLSHGNGAYAFAGRPTDWSASEWDDPNTFVGDVNADGRSDLVRVESTDPDPFYRHPLVRTAIATATGDFDFSGQEKLDVAWQTYAYPIPGIIRQTGTDLVQPGDFNGDGRMDLVFVAVVGKPAFVKLTTVLRNRYGPSTERISDIRTVPARTSNFYLYGGSHPPDVARFPNEWFSGDFNGDGTTDLAITSPKNYGHWPTTTQLRILPSEPSGGFDPNRVSLQDTHVSADCSDPGGQNCPVNRQVFSFAADTNGDGQSDVAQVGYSPLGRTTYNHDFLSIASTPVGGTARGWVPADYSGDGLTDLLRLDAAPGGLRVAIRWGREGGTFEAPFRGPDPLPVDPVDGPSPPTRGWQPADVDGDGRADLVRVQPDVDNPAAARVWVVRLDAAAQKWKLTSKPITLPGPAGAFGSPTAWHFGDIDGDGRADAVRVDALDPGLHIKTLRATPDGNWVPDDQPVAPDYTATDVQNWRSADLDGDGRRDLVHIYVDEPSRATTVDSFLADGHGKWRTGSDASSLSGRYLVDQAAWRTADITGDGLTDLVHIEGQGGALTTTTLIGAGNGTFLPRPRPPPPDSRRHDRLGALAARQTPDPVVDRYSDSIHWLAADVNGDGRTDLVHPRLVDDGDTRKEWVDAELSDGNGGFVDASRRAVGAPQSDRDWYAVDRDSDGIDDLLHIAFTPGTAGEQDDVAVDVLPPLAWRSTVTDFTDSNGLRQNVEYEFRRPKASADPQGFSCTVPLGTRVSTVTAITTIADGTADPSHGDSVRPRYACPRWSLRQRSLTAFAHVQTELDTVSYQHRVLDSQYYADETCGAQLRHERLDWNGGSLERALFYPPSANQPPVDCQPRVAITTYCAKHRCVIRDSTVTRDDMGNETSRTEGAIANTAYVGQTASITTDFRTDVDNLLLSLPTRTVLAERYGPTSQQLRETHYCYDDAIPDSSGQCVEPFTRGELTATLVRHGAGWLTTRQEFDNWGNVVRSVDPKGHATHTDFDPTEHLLPEHTCDAARHCFHTSYHDLYEVPKRIEDPNHAVDEIAYDAFGRLATETRPGHQSTSTHYENTGDPARQHVVTTTADGTRSGLWTRHWIDGAGRTWKLERKGPTAARTETLVSKYEGLEPQPRSVTHWQRGNTATVSEAYAYDPIGRLTSITHPDGTKAAIDYIIDEDLQATQWMAGVERTDEDGHRTRVLFDDLGHRAEAIQWHHGRALTARYVFDALGHQRLSVGPDSSRTSQRWDDVGRLRKISDSDLGIKRFDYDAAGNLRSESDPRGAIMRYRYDRIDRLVERRTTFRNRTSIARWHYDEPGQGAGIGRLTSEEDASARGCAHHRSMSATYSRAGDATRTTYCAAGRSVTIDRLFDRVRRPILMRITPDRQSVTYRYDPAGRLRSVRGVVTDLAYDAGGRVVRGFYPNHTIAVRNYDRLSSRLKRVSVYAPHGRVLDVRYGYTPGGNVGMTASPTNAANSRFHYDDLGRLQFVTGAHAQQWSYDVSGNIVRNSRVGQYIYHRAHPHAAVRAGRTRLAYDAAGNMIRRGRQLLKWNAEGRLVRVRRANGSRISYLYNADGDRVAERIMPSRDCLKKCHSRRFLFLGGVVERNAAGSIVSFPAGDGVVATRQGRHRTWLYQDRLGSPRLAVDRTGNVISRLDYAAFGTPDGVPSTGPGIRRAFTGPPYTPQTRLLHLRARDYDPILGRFLSPDTRIPDLNDPQTLNRYSYANNDPATLNDPSGHEADDPETDDPDQPLDTGQPQSAPESGVPGGTETEEEVCDAAGVCSTVITVTAPYRPSGDYPWAPPPATSGQSLFAPLDFARQLTAQLGYSGGGLPSATQREFTQVDAVAAGLFLLPAVAVATLEAAPVVGAAWLRLGQGFGLMYPRLTGVAVALTAAGACACSPAQLAEGKAAEKILTGLEGLQKSFPSLTGTAPIRYADLLNTEFGLAELKLSQYVYMSSQLKDQLAYAQQKGIPYSLVTTLETQLSKPVQNLVNSGVINWIPALERSKP